ncbi:MAG TPA: HEPN domain-containing protein [Xanthobacteraceae bacterium]|nr:HEPN domain-containing protein [Xanthobacteraceae bacterium]
MSDLERGIRAREEYEKALIHLAEAEQMAGWGHAPNASAHSAYYAMHHCAAAAILAAGGIGKHRDAPKSHEHVIQHFGNLVAAETGYLGQCGMVLGRARTDRMVADYDLVHGITNAEATEVVKDARKFVDACKGKWTFKDRAIDELNH